MGKVMLSSAAAADAWAKASFAGAESEVWVTYDQLVLTAGLAFFQANHSGAIVTLDLGGSGAKMLIEDDSGPIWVLQPGPPFGESFAAPPVADAYQTLEFHYLTDGTTELYVDTVLADTHTSNSPGDVIDLYLGQRAVGTTGADAIVYVRNPKAGTTRGGSDLFADDFSSGDFSAWADTFGDVSVVDDPLPEASGVPPGISLAFDSSPLDESPEWTRLDDPAQPWRTVSWEINGPNRNTETEQENTGGATLTIVDRDGTFDLTNPFSDLAGKLKPGRQAAICLADSNGSWHWRFRGVIDDLEVEVDQTARLATMTIELIDAFAYASQITMRPGVYGDAVPAGSEGDIFYAETPVDDPSEASSRMNDVLDTIGWPVALRRLFTGNVRLQDTVYSRDEAALTVLIDAAEAEFPGVGLLFTSKEGIITFHGRLARFDPETYSAPDDLSRASGNSICFWSVGSENVLPDDPAIVLLAGLKYRMSRKDVINDALCLPANVEETDVPGNHVEDTDSKAAYGTLTFTADTLRVLEGPDASTAVEQTLKYGQYFVDNFATPRTRLEELTFKGRSVGSTGWEALADFLAGVDISDVVTVTTRHWDGDWGFAEDTFVEGYRMTGTPDATCPGGMRVDAVLDVSPRAFYDTNVFA